MPTTKRCWRITPTAFVESQVEALAKREGRSLSNMMLKLLGEALEARRLASANQSGEVRKLVALLTAPAAPSSAAVAS
jgi:hypothetical protein